MADIRKTEQIGFRNRFSRVAMVELNLVGSWHVFVKKTFLRRHKRLGEPPRAIVAPFELLCNLSSSTLGHYGCIGLGVLIGIDAAMPPIANVPRL
jgi:hypothetical protein